MTTMTDESACVLVVDDDPAVGMVLLAQLGQAGIGGQHVLDARGALEFLRERPVDVVVTDLRMPGMSGVELLEDIVERWPEVPVILLTAHGTVAAAVEAMKKGAADFLLKPFDREEILFTVRKQIAAARHGLGPPRAEVGGDVLSGPTSSPAMRDARDLIRRAAASQANVLIRGENGTGKDLTARAIHKEGPRRDAPFVRVQCGALPDTLIESELFGYEKGAFTGAASRKPGRVELAEGGTLFLDEIGDITLVVQAKLLRLLQEREFERLGGTQTLKTTARFVAATHRPLEEMVRKGTFREDLFYRLNVLPIWIPPLRARADDIDALAAQFGREAGEMNGRGHVELTKQALAILRRQPWPGNVRQLQNFVERLVVLSDGNRLTAADVERELGRPLEIGGLAEPAPPRRPERAEGRADGVDRLEHFAAGTLAANRKEVEHEAIVAALARSGNNRSVAARLLGIGRRTLYHKLAEHGLL